MEARNFKFKNETISGISAKYVEFGLMNPFTFVPQNDYVQVTNMLKD